MNARPILRLLLLFLLVLVPVISGYAQDGNPRHPGVARFEEIGSYPAGTIWPLGDVSGDGIADVAIQVSIDTPSGSWRTPTELRILYGKPNGLPIIEDGLRLGATEALSNTFFLAVGDWDGDAYKDICARLWVFNDTSFGNTGKDIMQCVVFWGSAQGYSIQDTTRLTGGAQAWFGPYNAVSGNLSSGNVEDLIVYTWEGSGYQDEKVVRIPKLFIYRGHKGKRWGHGDVPNTPDWLWWNVPRSSGLAVKDLDRDNLNDLILYNYDAGPRPLSVFYGRQDGALPDTLEDLQQVDMQTIGSGASVFSDVTGDAIPDLCALNQAESVVYIYVGCKGQRLLEQFGTGNDPPQGERWWGRPWASVKGPSHVSNAWFGLENALFDLGSADSNATEEIWVVSSSFLLCYDVGGQVIEGVRYGLDSLFDGQVQGRLAGAKRVYDIDGDGRDEFALLASGGVHFYRTVNQLPTPTPTWWRVPQECGVSSAVEDALPAESGLAVRAVPNPASGDVRVLWTAERENGEAVIAVHDMLGQDVTTMRVPAHRGEAVWDAAKTFGGRYFITVTIGRRSETAEVIIQK